MQEARGGVGGRARILIVEDDESVARALAATLESEGYDVEHAADVRSALAKIESGPLDVALLGIRVGDADGLPVLTRLKELRPNAVGIVLAGHETLESALLALRAGADDLLLKPSGPAELRASLARASHWREVAQREQTARAESETGSRRMRFLAGASAVLAESLDSEAILQKLARLAVPAIADWCAVDVVTEDGSVRRLTTVHLDPDTAPLAPDLQQLYPAGRAAAYGVPRVLRTGRPELYPQITDDLIKSAAYSPEQLQVLQGLGLVSAMVLPLKARARTMGVITLATAESGRRYDESDFALAQDFAHRASVSIENARLHHDLQAQMDAHVELNTELRRLSEERDTLRRMAESRVSVLEELDRAKEEFLTTAGHDLKSPLTSIRGHTQMLLRRMRAPELELARMAEALHVIDEQAAALARLLDDLLDASAIQAGGLEPRAAPCDLGECLETVLDRLNPAELGRVDVLFPDLPLSGQWERRRIEQVLANLLGNALKYSPESERVSIRVERRAGEIEVAVSDRGLGIPPEELPHLFQRFHRTPQARSTGIPGTGLGLYICRGIVTAHGGRIWAESAGEGEGATFYFTLPVDPHSHEGRGV